MIPKNVEYMIDSNNTESATWENVKSVSKKLLNKDAADQAKTEDNSWGYTSVVGDSGDIKASVSQVYQSIYRRLVGTQRKEHYLSGNTSGR